MKPSNTDTQEIERAIGGEQAADLAALTAQAAPVPAPGAAATEAAAPQGPDLAGEIAGLVTAAVTVLAPMFPSLPTIYTPQTTQAAAAAVAAVCNKHGWAQGGLMGKWGEEIACLAVVGPLAFATYQGIAADLAARAPAKPVERIGGPDLSAPMPTEVAGAKTVTFSTDPAGAAA